MQSLLKVLQRLEITKDQIKPLIKGALSEADAEIGICEANNDHAFIGDWRSDDIQLDGNFNLNQLIAIIRLHPSITSE